MLRYSVYTIFILCFWAPVPASAAPTHLVEEPPVAFTSPARGVYLVDFGRVAFGNLQLTGAEPLGSTVTVRFGEALSEGRVDRNPPGTVRYKKARVQLLRKRPTVVAPRADRRNTEQDSDDHPPAILTPESWGVVMPFRWVEISGLKSELLPEQVVRRAAYLTAWDDNAAAFESSDDMLNRIWELSRYSIKATSFAGVYVDGDRERIPYEADAYLNQLSHYYTDYDKQMARDTFDHLIKHPTWPTEWASHMVFMAHADWMHTGDTQWLAARYESLKPKLLLDRVGPDGLVTSNKAQRKKGDLVDWPPAERDNYVFTETNTVVNAFFLRGLQLMSELAADLGEEEDAATYTAIRQRAHETFQEKLFSDEKQRYRDGTDTDHTSLHASLFPLAFDLTQEAHHRPLVAWLSSRGMACSVYAAQYFLEALFEHGAANHAVALMTAPGDRSWRHMVASGATITWEAWDHKYKLNQDWNHAWGAAPANLLPRFILGVSPAAPGWMTANISPREAGLSFARGKVPTAKGAILVDWRREGSFTLALE
ncbi:MAG: family 78 glycoside hydrolase catalytic domain, partial [Halioglobus sp.]|nr:family 78 glycoside hydrolase catalytic domain [Halioglobus sp.]